MKRYKTPAHIRSRLNAKRAAIKAAGGVEYDALLARERERRALYRQQYPDRIAAERKTWEEKRKRVPRSHRGDMRRHKVRGRLREARKRGIEVTISFEDIYWPTHCPILGIELDYKTPKGRRDSRNPANPSLDRWDNSKGYIPGNVYVISFRANVLKNNAKPEELEAIARYARFGLAGCVEGGLFSG